MPTVDLFQYMKDVQRRAGLRVSSSFPSTATDEEQLVLDSINDRLRFLNNRHYLCFKQTEYTLTTTAGTASYNLANAPYSQSFWRNYRIARNGIRRVTDDYPLKFLDYTERDYLRPSASSNGLPAFYSAFGESLLIWPPGDGSQLYIRYYATSIGTDSAGTTAKLNLTETDDLPMLNDEWRDVLITGAAMKTREQINVDEKYNALLRAWEQWENILIDMGNQTGGEDAPPELHMRPYIYNSNGPYNRYYPFFTGHE